MEIKITTKYNVGDTVWAFHYITDGDSVDNWHQGIEEMKIESIRLVIQEDGILVVEYFLEGLVSYEGENWFPENPDESYFSDAIFKTKEEAEEYFKKYIFFYRHGNRNNT